MTFTTDDATQAAVERLIERVAYSNTSEGPSTATREVTYTVVDGDGGADTGVATATITVTPVNDAPVIGGMGGTLAYTENDAATVIDDAVTLSDVDSSNMGGTLTVSFTDNGSSDDQLTILNEGTGAGQIGVSSNTITYAGQTIGTFAGGDNGNDLVVTFTTDDATQAAVERLIERVAYSNTSEGPSTATREVTYTVVDGDGGADTGVATATITVTPVNDAPVIGGMGGTLAYTENDAATVIDDAVTLSDVNSSNMGGTLTVSFTDNGSSDDQLTILNEGTGAGQIGVSSNTITYAGQTIGTFAGGDNGNDLVVTFTTDDATQAAVERLIERVAYSNTSEGPSTATREVTYTVVDGDGGADTGVATATITVTPVNDAPVIGGMGGTLAYTENDAATVIDDAVTLSDVTRPTWAGR